MKVNISISDNTYKAIMFSALQAFRRESWLIEACDIHDATGEPTADIIEGMFTPFCDRLIKASTFDKSELSESAARFGFFKQFSEMAV
jgi:hypothetical protein